MDYLDSYLCWYNEKRIKISLGGLSPACYRKQLGLAAWFLQENVRTPEIAHSPAPIAPTNTSVNTPLIVFDSTLLVIPSTAPRQAPTM